MIGLILSGLLACAHGLGDTQPYTNSQTNTWATASFAAGDWAAGVCSTGTRQSPIDIVSTAAIVTKPDVGAIMSTGFEVDAPVNYLLNGRFGVDASPTAIEVTSPNPAFISGGPLDESYKFSHIEFHWAKAAGGLGSEHSMDGTKAAMEMHVVHHKTKLTTAQLTTGVLALDGYSRAAHAAYTSATVDPAGVAVIAYQIDVGTENAELLPLTTEIARDQAAVVAAYGIFSAAVGTCTAGGTGNCACVGSTSITGTTGSAGCVYTVSTAERPLKWSTVNGAAPTTTSFAAGSMNMSALMMLDQGALDDYYYYDGSLTAPADINTNDALGGCAEIVRWIIPNQRLTMSTAQVAVFAAAFKGAGPAAYPTNSRPIQTGARITGITVNRRVPTVVKDNAVWRNLAGTLLSVGTFGLVHNLLTQDETAKALTENPVVDILQDIEQRFNRPAPQERQSFNHHHHPQEIQY